MLPEHPAALINIEWWTVGALSRALGGHPFLAYRLVGALAALALFAGLARLLTRAGLPEDRLPPSLLLVGAGGGFGGLLLEAGWLTPLRSLDFSSGLFPFVGLLANAHFTVGTALLLWGVLGFASETVRGQAMGIGCGVALGLVRPYDMITLVALRAAFIALRNSPRDWPRRALPLLGLLPPTLWNYWVFYANPAFAFYAKAPYVFPARLDLLLALAPAALLALLALRAAGPDGRARSARLYLSLWCALGGLLIALQPVRFAFQFLTGLGLPLLVFGALGLARFPRAVAWGAVLAFSTSALVALRLALLPLPYWFTAREKLDAARSLGALCQPGDVAFAPQDVGLFLAGLSPCKAFVSHASHPAYAERAAETLGFYSEMPPAQRAELLDRACARFVLFPGDAGEAPLAWLPADAGFRRAALVGAPPRQISIYSRRRVPACRP